MTHKAILIILSLIASACGISQDHLPSAFDDDRFNHKVMHHVENKDHEFKMG